MTMRTRLARRTRTDGGARLRLDERTRAYAARRTAEGLSKREIIRCLQRYVARELYHALVALPPSSSSWPPHRLPVTGQP